MSEGQVPCKCLPPWYSDMVYTGLVGYCVGCEQSLAGEEFRVGCTLLMRCAFNNMRGHAATCLFHSEGNCTQLFEQKLQQRQRHKACDKLPGVMKGGDEPPLSPLFKKVAQACCEKHIRTGFRCSNCGTYGEKKNVSLKRCSKCMTARYCSEECQKEHWPKHKMDCFCDDSK